MAFQAKKEYNLQKPSGLVMKLRPHHIYCFHMLGLIDPDRGPDYLNTRDEIERAFIDRKGEVEVNQGPDILCASCTYYNGDGCAHPKGDETQVKKWDDRIIQELNLEYGHVLSIDDAKSLIRENAPLDFCINRCPYSTTGACDPNELPDYL